MGVFTLFCWVFDMRIQEEEEGRRKKDSIFREEELGTRKNLDRVGNEKEERPGLATQAIRG